MSESKAALVREGQSLRANRDEMFGQLTRLLAYVEHMREMHPELDWPELPDTYAGPIWRAVA